MRLYKSVNDLKEDWLAAVEYYDNVFEYLLDVMDNFDVGLKIVERFLKSLEVEEAEIRKFISRFRK